MNTEQVRDSIKKIVDSTNNESLLMYWEKQLQWDIENSKETNLSNKEWHLVKEGLAEYENGDTLSLEEFINKR